MIDGKYGTQGMSRGRGVMWAKYFVSIMYAFGSVPGWHPSASMGELKLEGT